MSLSEEYTIICIDGGGTKTDGVIYSGNKELAHLKLGSTRVGAVGVGEACERVLTIIIELCKSAEIKTSQVDVIVAGLAGIWLDSEKKRALNLIKTLANTSGYIINDLIMTSDAEIALAGALENTGIITIIGTGSIGLAKYSQNNELARCGGWGIELDDEGSGAWVGREGVTAIVRSLDGRGKPTLLKERFFRHDKYKERLNESEPRSIVSAYNDKLFEYHEITPLVMECAVDGDTVCMDIIKRASVHLAELPLSLLKHFETNDKIDVALMGGIIDNDTLLGNLLKKELSNVSQINLINPRGNALSGAKNIGIKNIIEMQND